MKKKILVHMSTNGNTSNFGDVVFADMILRYLSQKGYSVSFYELSTYVENYLYDIKRLPHDRFSMDKADGLVYFAGGYFGEPKGIRYDSHYRHYKRFMPFGKEAVKKNKKLAVIGIGGGPYLWLPSRKVVKRVCDHSSCITSRDEETAAYLKKLCPKAPVVVTTDIAQALDPSTLKTDEKLKLSPDNKYVYIHMSYKRDVGQKFAEALKPFLDNHPEVKVIAGADSLVNFSDSLEDVRGILGADNVIHYTYTTPDNLISILRQCDLIITYKLHVGIFSAALGKSVIAFAKHEKIPRYYRQINETGRCMMFDSASARDITVLIEQYFSKGIVLSDEIRRAASENWKVLDRFLDEL